MIRAYLKMKNKIVIIIFSCFLLIGLFSCKLSNSSVPEVSFYHWKSYFDLDSTEIKYLELLKVDKLYIRYFDIDFQNNKIIPIGKIQNIKNFIYQNEIIPCIFITNNTFKNIQLEEIDSLCDNIIKLIQSKHSSIGKQGIKTLQIDCDWTLSTKDVYFQFLQKLKEKSGWDISVTIRLHQISYKEKTGVPPANHFVLMCYNTGDLNNPNEENSILNINDLKQYKKGMSDYPHQLSIALPLFSWAVVLRERKVIKLIRNIDINNFKNNSNFEVQGNKIIVKNSTYLKGYYLYKGDILRCEKISIETLLQTAQFLQKHIHTCEIIYYHLDIYNIKNYPYERIETINRQFNCD